MKLDYCATIGLICDFECEIEASIDWDNGEPILVIDDVTVDGHSLSRNDDSLMQLLAYRIADLAEDDEDLLSTAIDMDGLTYVSRGAHDPDGHWREAL